MSGTSKIEWTEKTWNPTTGCSKVSQGCKHCYAEREWTRLSANPKSVYFGRAFTDVECHEERLDAPMHWRKPSMIFVNSMSDLFHESVPFEFIDKVFAVMARARQHTYQILTKRPERMRDYMASPRHRKEAVLIASEEVELCGMEDCTWPIPNVWLGTSVEDPKSLHRIDTLRAVPAAVRFVSFEPLLANMGPVNLDGIGWAIVGGESGPGARPMDPKWARSLRDQCGQARVQFFFKQWGEWAPAWLGAVGVVHGVRTEQWVTEGETGPGRGHELHQWSDTQASIRVGKHAAGRLLDGIEWSEYPERAA
jgi:protein gp37